MPFRDLQDLADDTIFSADVGFGESITYAPLVGPPVVILGIPFQRAQEIGLSDGSVLSSTEHLLDLRESSVSGGPLVGASVTIRSILHKIIDVQGPDDSGVVRCVLHLAATP